MRGTHDPGGQPFTGLDAPDEAHGESGKLIARRAQRMGKMARDCGSSSTGPKDEA